MLEEERYWLVKIVRLTQVIILFILINSCTTVASVTAMVGNASTSEKGFTKTLEDTYMMSKILAKITSLKIQNFVNVKVSVFFAEVLITGYTKDQESRLGIINSIWEVKGVKKIYNEIEIGDGPSLAERTEAITLQSKIKTKLLFKSGILSNNYSIDVVNKKVYVIGVASNVDEKALVDKYLSEIDGIRKLVTIISLPRMK